MAFSRRRKRAAEVAPEDNTPQTPIKWTRLFRYLGPYKGYVALAIVALLIYTGTNLVFPSIVGQIIATISGQKNLDMLNRITGGLLALFLIQALFSFAQSYILNYIGERIVLDMRTQIFSHLQSLSFDFYANRRVGEIISRISSDVTQVRALLTTSITTFLGQIVTLVGSIVLMFILNPSLMVFIVALIVVLIVVAIGFGRPLQRLSTKVADELADATVVATEALNGIRVVKSFTREPYEIGRYDKAMKATFDSSMIQARYRGAFGALMSFLGFGTIAAILWFSGREVIEGRLNFDSIIVFLLFAINVAASLGGLTGLYSQFRETLGSTRRVFEILDTPSTIQDKPQASTLSVVKGQITFENVSFAYENKVIVLDQISLDIAPGEIIALVGPSGAGKSTVFNLIPRFYDPIQGAVKIDGIDLRDVTQASLRAQIGLVPQETVLFGDTVRENILYGRLDATEAEVIAAAKAANAHDFIMETPMQYDTLVGERGVKLSGGQRQRIAIARAILKNPRILLLDEATSALDSESEELVQEALDRLMQGRTTVIIAHRLSTIKIAHRIAVLDHGRIVELGTHDELIEANGLYAKLYHMQFREGDEAISTGNAHTDRANPLEQRAGAGARAIST